MEEGGNILLEDKKKRSLKDKFLNSKTILTISIILIVLILFYLAWIFLIDEYEACKTWECFNENLASCNKAKFAGGKEIIFGYIIEGKKGDNCKVEVQYLQGEISNKDSKRLKGEKMMCNLPSGIIMLPESDLSRCTGTLKEKLQEQVIEQLHSFIVQNLGQINKELLNPLNYQSANNY